MEDVKEGDVRVPIAFTLFGLCVAAGGVLLILYVFVPSASQAWYPIAALALIGFPWFFWLLIYLYACIKGCSRRQAAAQDQLQIPRRQTTRNASSTAAEASGGGELGGGDPFTVSSREPEMPLTTYNSV